MKRIVPCLFLLWALPAHAQLWSGIIDPSRATDWADYAGVTGGIPTNYTQCIPSGTTSAGVPSTASAATIQGYLNGCSSKTYLLLQAGTFSLSTGLSIPSNVILRGAGNNQTILNCTGAGGFYWGSYCVGFIGNYDTSSDNGSPPGFGGCAGTCTKISWSGTCTSTSSCQSGTYTKGSTIINLASAPTGLSVGMMIELVQNDDSGVTSGWMICSTAGTCSEVGGGLSYYGTAMRENHIVTAINGTTVTLQEPIGEDQWRTSQSPIAYYQACCEVRNAGVENLRIVQASGVGNCISSIVVMYQAINVWVKGISTTPTSGIRDQFLGLLTAHITYQDSWLDSAGGVFACSADSDYGMEWGASSYALIQNNIYNQVESPILPDGQNFGNVIAYNYINQRTNDDSGLDLHDVAYNFGLIEGNESSTCWGDDEHGSKMMVTWFRNYCPGINQNALMATSYNRYYNVVGNVLGNAPFPSGSLYLCATPNSATTCEDGRFGENIYYLGYNQGGGTVNDTLVESTIMKWANYDTATGANRFCGNSSDTGWSTTCGSTSEVPTGLSQYANAVPTLGDTGAGQGALPASFFYPSRPSWWPSGKVWPYVGPDVSGGNITGYAGHAYTSPAHDCFTSVTGSITSFNAATCFGSTTSTSAPQAPTGLVASLQ